MQSATQEFIARQDLSQLKIEIKSGKKKNYLIDIDGTISDDVDNEEPLERFLDAKVLPGAKEFVLRLYNQGHRVYFFTSRTSKHHRIVTLNWLKSNGFRYHGIIFDKPRFGNYHWIDNLEVTGHLFKGEFNSKKNFFERLINACHAFAKEFKNDTL
jgi:hypothetical protein